MKYTIDYGCGTATLFTPFDCKERFNILANTCFGIRKSIMGFKILKTEDVACDYFERLEFNGDVYVWREDGARKQLLPDWASDEEWDTDYCEEVAYKPIVEKDGPVLMPIVVDPPDSVITGECDTYRSIREVTEAIEKANADKQPKILDSGDRTEFETGAVRDMREGKGRCDLMPLGVIGCFYTLTQGSESTPSIIFGNLAFFTETGRTDYLYRVLRYFDGFDNYETMFLEVSKHFEEGAKKYGENNWQKGIPVRCYIDSAVRHYLKYLRGDKDEPHDRAFVWNILCAIWTCIHKPELNDYAKKGEE